MMKNLYLIVGPSGSGKSVIADEMSNRFDGNVVQSCTDRPKRTEDETGHIFLSEKEFDELPPLVAYTVFSGHRYGVTSKQLDECDFYVIDPAGVIYLYKHYKGDKNIVVIGLTTNDDILKKRLKERDGHYLRRFHDRDVFTKSVMNLICDEIVDTSCDMEEMLTRVEEVIKKYEGK